MQYIRELFKGLTPQGRLILAIVIVTCLTILAAFAPSAAKWTVTLLGFTQ